jgi:ABC-type polysaccharide transport system, permease component
MNNADISPNTQNKTNIAMRPRAFWNKFIKQGPIIARDFSRNKYLYLMAIPGLLFYVIFHYFPMYGAIIAFKNYRPSLGIMQSSWVGLKNFTSFFQSYYFWSILKNTILINCYELLWGFPAPIILALLLNEIRNEKFKKSVQTVTYLPHFISTVVICGLIVDFTSQSGLFNNIVSIFGGTRSNFLMKPELFRTIYVSSEIWQSVGWGSIIFLAALTGIDPELYNAATVDGANRFKQALHVTLPGIAPTIVIMLILRIGKMMNVGAEKILLLYSPTIYDTADVISTFVYRKGLIDANYSYSAAVGLFNSVINFTLLILANKISRKVNDTSLW